MPHRIFSYAVIITLALAAGVFLGGCTLAADVTPPPNYRPPTNTQPAVEGPVYPLMAPDPANAAAIYAEKCAPCHGDTGGGDGPQAGKLANPVPAIGLPAVAHQAVPSDWYAMITYGNLERFMPGFVNSLSDRQRWDVLAYVLNMSSPAEQLSAGQEVYASACADCHGPDGSGAEAANLADQEKMAALSNAAVYETLSAGAGPHAAAADLSQEERWDVVSYVRSFTMGFPVAQSQAAAQTTAQPSLPSGETPAAAAETPAVTDRTAVPETPGSDQPASLGSVYGTVESGSGAELPTGLVVTLRGYDGMEETYTQTSPVQPDGSYRFSDVEMPGGRVFMTTVETADAVYNSDIAHPEEGPRDIELPILIYDQTSDLTGLSVDRMHVFFDFATPGTMQVVELFIVSNPTGKLITGQADGQPVLTYDLPEGATNLQFQDGAIGERYVLTETGFGDLAEIVPGQGQHQVLFAFELPFDRSADVTLPLPLPVQAAVVMIPDAGIKAQSSQLQSAGQRDVQGMTFQVLNGSDLPAGQALTISLSGRPQAAGEAGQTAPAGIDNNLLIGLAVFGLALIGSGAWLYSSRTRRLAQDPEQEPIQAAEQDDADTLMEAIIALDDLHRTGKIPEAAYQQRRAELKEQLRARMG